MPMDAGWPTTYDCDSRQPKLATDTVWNKTPRHCSCLTAKGRVIRLTPEWSATLTLGLLQGCASTGSNEPLLITPHCRIIGYLFVGMFGWAQIVGHDPGERLEMCVTRRA